MIVLKRWITVLSCFCMVAMLNGQQKPNPFDQLHRKSGQDQPKKVNLDKNTASNATSNATVLDTIASNASIRIDSSAIMPATSLDPKSNAPLLDSVAGIAVLEEESLTDKLPENADSKDSIEQNQSTNTNSKNPFDVGIKPPPNTIVKDANDRIENDTNDAVSEDNDNASDKATVPAVNEDGTEVEILPTAPVVTEVDSEDRAHTPNKGLSGVVLALIFFAIFLLLTIIVNINRGLINKIYRAALNENFSALLYRETKHSALSYLYPLAYVVFFLNLGLFLYLIQGKVEWASNAESFAFWVLTLIPLAIYLGRHTTMKLLGHIFPFKKEINQFNFNIMIFNIMLGLILIPINLFLAYGPSVMHLPLLYGAIFIIAIVYLVRQLRGVLISSRLITNNIFLFFIYLCTVEILPMLVLFRYIV